MVWNLGVGGNWWDWVFGGGLWLRNEMLVTFGVIVV